MKVKKMLGVLLAVLLCFSFVIPLVACGDPDDNSEPVDRNKDPYVKSVEILTQPTKTTYFEGEVFNPSGLTFNATWIIEGKEKVIKLTHGTCQSWTHKNEPLTADVDKITFTIYGCTFDIPITVEAMAGAELVVDRSTVRAEYNEGDAIDFSGVVVRAKKTDGTFLSVSLDNCGLFDGETAIAADDRRAYVPATGEHTFKITYLDMKYTFGVNVIARDEAILPYHVQAEEHTYLYRSAGDTADGTAYDAGGTESNTLWNKKESTSWYNKGAKENTFIRLSTGAEGTAISNTERLKTWYIKFNVTVPADGEYDIWMRAQSVANTDLSQLFRININEEKDTDGTSLKYTAANTTDKVMKGNQRFLEDGQTLDGIGWFNMYFWTFANLGTYTLKKGENVIRLQPTGDSSSPNIDYFEVRKAATSDVADGTTSVTSVRKGEAVALDDDTPLYLSLGTKLGDITGMADSYASKVEGDSTVYPVTEHYTLVYLRVYGYVAADGTKVFMAAVPVTEEMITGIDYTQAGEYTASVSYTVPGKATYTASFKVIITA